MFASTVGSLETARQNVPFVSQTFPARFRATRADPWYAPPTSNRKLKCLPFRGIRLPKPTMIEGDTFTKSSFPVPVIGAVGSLSYDVPPTENVCPPGTDAVAVTWLPL